MIYSIKCFFKVKNIPGACFLLSKSFEFYFMPSILAIVASFSSKTILPFIHYWVFVSKHFKTYFRVFHYNCKTVIVIVCLLVYFVCFHKIFYCHEKLCSRSGQDQQLPVNLTAGVECSTCQRALFVKETQKHVDDVSKNRKGNSCSSCWLVD